MAAVPVVRILVLGDPDCGKSTFLAQLPHARHGLPTSSPLLHLTSNTAITLNFDVSLFARPYTFHITSSSSPNQLSLPAFPKPDMVILTYDISSHQSLHSLQRVWWHHLHINYVHLEERLPVMLLGLKRDLRNKVPETDIVVPHEGHHMAQKLRCDSYAECSALTGELMWEVLEDVSKMAAKTTTEKGAKTQNSSCGVM